MDMLERRNMLAQSYNEENLRQAVDLIVNHYFIEIKKLFFTGKQKMSFSLSDQALLLIKQAIKQFPEIKKAVIFGSRAMGNYRNGSDVDLAIFGEEKKLKIVFPVF